MNLIHSPKSSGTTRAVNSIIKGQKLQRLGYIIRKKENDTIRAVLECKLQKKRLVKDLKKGGLVYLKRI